MTFKTYKHCLYYKKKGHYQSQSGLRKINFALQSGSGKINLERKSGSGKIKVVPTDHQMQERRILQYRFSQCYVETCQKNGSYATGLGGGTGQNG